MNAFCRQSSTHQHGWRSIRSGSCIAATFLSNIKAIWPWLTIHFEGLWSGFVVQLLEGQEGCFRLHVRSADERTAQSNHVYLLTQALQTPIKVLIGMVSSRGVLKSGYTSFKVFSQHLAQPKETRFAEGSSF